MKLKIIGKIYSYKKEPLQIYTKLTIFYESYTFT